MPVADAWPRNANFPVVAVRNAVSDGKSLFAFAGWGLFAPMSVGDSSLEVCRGENGWVVPTALDADSLNWLDLSDWSGDKIIPAGLYRVMPSARIPEGRSLHLAAGAALFFELGADLEVDGSLFAEGTSQMPVVLSALDASRPWGGVLVRGQATLQGAFLTSGGANLARVYGHSGSHPVLDCMGGTVHVAESWIVHNVGKGVGGTACEFVLDSSLVAWSDMGGEFHDCRVRVANSAFLFFPDSSTSPRDDDNDALYLLASQPTGADSVWSVLDSSVFYHGLDDGLDHNGALVRVRASRFAGFTN